MKFQDVMAKGILATMVTALFMGLPACGKSGEEVVRKAPPVTVASPTIGAVTEYAVFTGPLKRLNLPMWWRGWRDYWKQWILRPAVL